jgi:hypothetical protein
MQVGRGERGGKNTQADSQHQTRFGTWGQSVHNDLACASNDLMRKSSLSNTHDGGWNMCDGRQQNRVALATEREGIGATMREPSRSGHKFIGSKKAQEV